MVKKASKIKTWMTRKVCPKYTPVPKQVTVVVKGVEKQAVQEGCSIRRRGGFRELSKCPNVKAIKGSRFCARASGPSKYNRAKRKLIKTLDAIHHDLSDQMQQIVERKDGEEVDVLLSPEQRYNATSQFYAKALQNLVEVLQMRNDMSVKPGETTNPQMGNLKRKLDNYMNKLVDVMATRDRVMYTNSGPAKRRTIRTLMKMKHNPDTVKSLRKNRKVAIELSKLPATKRKDHPLKQIQLVKRQNQ